MAKLSSTVHVDGKVYGPDDDVPAGVAARITNPKAWAEPPAGVEPEARVERSDEEPAEESVPDEEPADSDAPPRGGPGSGRDAWVAYADGKVEVSEQMTRDDIIAALDAAGVPTE